VLYLLWQIAERVERPIMRTVTVSNIFSEIYQNESLIMTRTTSWRWNDNGTIKVHTVTSTFQDAEHPNETKAEFRARHDAKCDADELIYPPIGY
jgi:hypothetical protein